MESYEAFKKHYPVKETEDSIIVEEIKQNHTSIYVPYLMDILKQLKTLTIPVLKALATYNPKLKDFTPEQMTYIVKKLNEDTNFQEHREDSTLLPLISTLLSHGLWEKQFIEYCLENPSIWISYLDHWLSYIRLKKRKIVDTSSESYFSYIQTFTNIDVQRQFVSKTLPYLTLDPFLKLLSSNDEPLFRENIFIYSLYIKNIADFLKQLDQRITQENNPEDINIRSLFIEQFSIKKKTQFRFVIHEMEKASERSMFQNEYYKKMGESISFLKNFIILHYDSKDKKFLDAWDQVKYNYFEKRKQDIPFDLETFLNKLPDLHQKMVLLRTKEELHQYTSKLNINELNQRDVYGLTPIAYAILFKNVEAVDYLMTTSASFEKRQTIGKKNVDYSILLPYSGHGISNVDLAKYMNSKQIIKLLETKQKTIERWKSNTLIGFHQTNKDVVDLIKETPKNEYWFLAGSTGMYGAGIYFAKTALETIPKAHKTGIILRNELYMGKPFYIKSFSERAEFQAQYLGMDSDMIHYELSRRKYDSVIAVREGINVGQFMRTGDEYIVYNTEQVKFLEILPELPEIPIKKGGSLNSPIHFPEWVLPIQQKDLTTLKTLKHTFHQCWIFETTPLMIACANGNQSMVDWLLSHVDIQEKDGMGRNALYYAIQNNDSSVLQHLLTHKIDVFVQDMNGNYCVDYFNLNDIEKHLQDPTYKIETPYRTTLLNALYKMGIKANPLIVRFYLKTGRVTDPVERERYEAYIQSYYTPSSITRLPIENRTIKVAGNKNI